MCKFLSLGRIQIRFQLIRVRKILEPDSERIQIFLIRVATQEMWYFTVLTCNNKKKANLVGTVPTYWALMLLLLVQKHVKYRTVFTIYSLISVPPIIFSFHIVISNKSSG